MTCSGCSGGRSIRSFKIVHLVSCVLFSCIARFIKVRKSSYYVRVYIARVFYLDTLKCLRFIGVASLLIVPSENNLIIVTGNNASTRKTWYNNDVSELLENKSSLEFFYGDKNQERLMLLGDKKAKKISAYAFACKFLVRMYFAMRSYGMRTICQS